MSVITHDGRPVRRPLADERRPQARRRARAGRCSPRTCSAPTARWRTSAAATPRPRAPPPITSAARSRRSGSRARAATWRRWRRRDFTPLRLDEILPLFERDEMSDEEMVAHLARCQLDPAAPRSSIETLLHAFIPAPHVHHTHPDAINVLACAETASGWSPSASAKRRLDRVHPPGLHARQAGRRGRPRQPGRSSSSCSPSTASSSGATPPRRPTSGRSRSATRRPSSSTRRPRATQRFGGPPSAGRRPTRAETLLRGPAGAARRGLRASAASCWSPTCRRAVLEFVDRRRGAAADRGRRRLSRSPGPHQAGAAVGPVTTRHRRDRRRSRADRRRRAPLPRRLRAYFDEHADATT